MQRLILALVIGTLSATSAWTRAAEDNDLDAAEPLRFMMQSAREYDVQGAIRVPHADSSQPSESDSKSLLANHGVAAFSAGGPTCSFSQSATGLV